MTKRLIKNIEGNTYQCAWKKSGRRFILSLTGVSPALEVRADTFEKAQDLLWAQIVKEFKDGEALLDFTPAPPGSELPASLALPPLYLLTGNDSVHVRGEKAELFTGGVCPKCGNPVGKRNKTDVTVEVLPKSSDGGIVWGVGPVYSEQFITLLTVKERDECRFRQVVTATASRRHFFELAGKPVGDWVAACTLGGSGGFGCISCSRRVVYHTIGRTIVRILEKSASLHPTGGVRVAGAAPFNGLVCSLARWDELRGKPGTKNIVAQRIGIAKPDQINDKPAVEIVR